MTPWSHSSDLSFYPIWAVKVEETKPRSISLIFISEMQHPGQPSFDLMDIGFCKRWRDISTVFTFPTLQVKILWRSHYAFSVMFHIMTSQNDNFGSRLTPLLLLDVMARQTNKAPYFCIKLSWKLICLFEVSLFFRSGSGDISCTCFGGISRRWIEFEGDCQLHFPFWTSCNEPIQL